MGSYGDKIHLNGSVAMPIFFILSGFSLSVIYGENLNKTNFYRNRFARIYPVYLLTMIFALPLKFTDFGGPKEYQAKDTITWMISIITNLLLINMWILTAAPINGPSWFVSVLWFQYIIFPFTIKCYKSSHNKIISIIPHVILTMMSSTFLFMKFGFVLATMNIISPSFFMFHAGVLSGLWCHETTIELQDNENKERIMKQWATYTDMSTFLLFLWVSLSTIIQLFGISYSSNFIIQIYGTPFMLLTIISSTLDGGTSKFATLCNTKQLQFLGKISMSLYLVHYPLIQYFCLILEYVAPHTLELTDYDNPLLEGGSMPWWGVFIMVPLSLVVAFVLERFVESPCRKFLRCERKRDENVNMNTPLLDGDAVNYTA